MPLSGGYYDRRLSGHYGVIVLIVAAIAIPQIIMAWCSGKDSTLEKQIEILTQEIETLKQQQSVTP